MPLTQILEQVMEMERHNMTATTPNSQGTAATQIDEETAEENEIVFPAEIEDRVQAMTTMSFEQYIAAQALEAEDGGEKEGGGFHADYLKAKSPQRCQ